MCSLIVYELSVTRRAFLTAVKNDFVSPLETHKKKNQSSPPERFTQFEHVNLSDGKKWKNSSSLELRYKHIIVALTRVSCPKF